MMRLAACVFLLLQVVSGEVKRQNVLPGGSLGIQHAYDGQHCDVICDDELHIGSAVCASDNILYKSHCDFKNAMCMAAHSGHLLSIVSYDTCITMDTPCDVVIRTNCIHHFPGTDGASAPMCGSDNRTYDSVCEFRLSQCHNGHMLPSLTQPMPTQNLTVLHAGKCVIDTTNALMINCSQYVVDNSGLALEGGAVVSILGHHCSRLYKPVCGIDPSRSYTNECQLCHYKIATHSLVKDSLIIYAAHKGLCTGNNVIG